MNFLEEYDMTIDEFTELEKKNSSLRGYISGYVSEWHFEKLVDKNKNVQHHYKPQDQDRNQKGDRIITYRDIDISFEVRAIYTDTVISTQDLTGNISGSGSFKTKCARSRTIKFSDGSEVNTWYNPRGLVDVFCVCIKPITQKWEYQYCLNSDIPSPETKDLTKLQKQEILKCDNEVRVPPQGFWTDDLDVVLERAYQQKLKNNLNLLINT